MSLSSTQRLPVTVVTGFLGAGKSTLLRHLLSHAAGRRIALIVNEFGDVGFDGALLSACVDPACVEDDVVELTNGCLCCTVADDFLPTMEKLLDRADPPDHIVIETSGLALPQPLLKAFQWPSVRARSTVDAVIVVVDAAAVADGRFAPDPERVAAQRLEDAALDHDGPLEELFEDQLSAADLVVLTKVDLIRPEQLLAVRGLLEAEIRPGVAVVEAAHGSVGASALLGLAARAEDDLAARQGHHAEDEPHDHDDFDSVVLPVGPLPDRDAAVELVGRLVSGPGILRVKGRVAVAGKAAPLWVQAVGTRLETWFGRPGEAATGLVVIGLAPLDQDALAAGLAAARAA